MLSVLMLTHPSTELRPTRTRIMGEKSYVYSVYMENTVYVSVFFGLFR